ncbi:MAG TPA: hypothetical protein VFJ02_06395 [Vicinamibacterales bacterium]|nr:hypothetical protein [Vicinamibacterales bacterium]
MTIDTARRSVLLRRVLLADAVISGATGIAMMLGAETLGALFGVPGTLLRWAGVSLIPFAGFVGVLAARESVAAAAVRAVIVANVLWAVDSVLLLFTGWVDPSLLGYAFIIGQAVIVAALAEIQHIGLKSATLPAY